MKNAGNTISSAIIMKMKLLATLPRYNSPRPSGASNSPWIQSLSISMASDRFSPRMAAKLNATHSVPGAIIAFSILLDSNANMKITKTRMPNINMELMDSLLRISMTMSLKMIAVTGFIVRFPRGCKRRTRREWPDLSNLRKRRSSPDP